MAADEPRPLSQNSLMLSKCKEFELKLFLEEHSDFHVFIRGNVFIRYFFSWHMASHYDPLIIEFFLIGLSHSQNSMARNITHFGQSSHWQHLGRR